MSNPQVIIQQFLNFLKNSSYSIKIPDDWLCQCAEFMVEQFPV